MPSVPMPPVRQPGAVYLEARDLATMYGVAVGTVHSWASRYGWARRRVGGRVVRYNAADAQRTYDALHPQEDTP